MALSDLPGLVLDLLGSNRGRFGCRKGDQVGDGQVAPLLFEYLYVFHHGVGMFAHHSLRSDGITFFDGFENDHMLGNPQPHAKQAAFEMLRRVIDRAVEHHGPYRQHRQVADLFAGIANIVISAPGQN